MQAAPARRSAWIPWAFVAFMALVVVANGVMVWLAVSTFTGTTVERAFERGRHYNQVLAEAERQRALGWHLDIAWAQGEGGAGRIVVTALDAAGAPLDRLSLAGVALRPLERPDPIPVALAEVARGRYAGALALPRAGQWEIRLEARRGAQGPVEVSERIVVR